MKKIAEPPVKLKRESQRGGEIDAMQRDVAILVYAEQARSLYNEVATKTLLPSGKTSRIWDIPRLRRAN
jgi:hypothetical protein